jgi:hypothetical protein
MIKGNLTILFICLGCILHSVAYGQFVNVRLQIPGGVQFKTKIINDPIVYGIEPTVWMELAGNDNLSLLISINDEDTNEKRDFLILNNGSSDFSKALKVKSNTPVLLSTKGKNKGVNKPKPKIIRAWVGIPLSSGMEERMQADEIAGKRKNVKQSKRKRYLVIIDYP